MSENEAVHGECVRKNPEELGLSPSHPKLLSFFVVQNVSMLLLLFCRTILDMDGRIVISGSGQ
jgi:hypothetical protein